jgi:hypothetical protein
LAVLAQWPRLSDLAFRHTNLHGTFVEQLASLALPLTHFGLSHCATLRSASVVKLVQARLDAGAKLQSLILVGCPALEPEGIIWLRGAVPYVKLS